MAENRSRRAPDFWKASGKTSDRGCWRRRLHVRRGAGRPGRGSVATFRRDLRRGATCSRATSLSSAAPSVREAHGLHSRPDGRICGMMVDSFAKRPQVQERLTRADRRLRRHRIQPASSWCWRPSNTRKSRARKTTTRGPCRLKPMPTRAFRGAVADFSGTKEAMPVSLRAFCPRHPRRAQAS